MTLKLRYFVDAISESETAPQNSPYDRFVGLEHYDSGELEITRYSDTSLLSSSVKVFHKNDILIARRNVYLKRAGIVLFNGLTSGDSIILRVKPDSEKTTGVPYEIALRWLPLLLNSSVFWAYANKHADGMNSKRISKEMLLDYEFDAPSLDEIVSVTERVWAAHELKNRYRALLKATDEIVKSRFIEEFGNPVTNSKSWPTKPLSEVAPESPSTNKATGLVWVLNLDMVESQSGRVIEKVYDNVENLNSVAAFDDGNVLFSKLRPYLNKVVIPNGKGYATTELVPLRPDTTIVRKEFLACLLRSNDFVNYADAIATGTKMPRMPMTALRDFKCIIPPVDLQDEFIKVSRQADKSKFELKQAIDKIDRVMRSLLQ